MSGGGYVDAAAAHVLANNEILMSAPSNGKLSGFYPTPAESTNTIAQAVCNSGQLFVRANSKQFGAPSDFQISTANILDCPILSMQIVIAPLNLPNNPQSANTFIGTHHAGWGYDIIESLEVSYSNSNISNLIVSGQAMKEWSLLQCKNKAERLDLLRGAGELLTFSRDVPATFSAAVPISFLNWQGAGGVTGGFPIDARTLNGSIQFQFRFKALSTIITPQASFYLPGGLDQDLGTGVEPQYGLGVDGVLPTEFSILELTMRTYQLMDSAFSVAHALQANPGMVYSLPSKWVNTYRYTVDITDGIGEVQLNSAPAGMIQAILVSVRPVLKDSVANDMNWNAHDVVTANRGNKVYYPGHYHSIPLKTLRLQYSGQSIYDAHSHEQILAFNKFVFCDDLNTLVPSWPRTMNMSVVTNKDTSVTPQLDGNATAGPIDTINLQVNNDPQSLGIDWEVPIHVIPLMHNGDFVFRKRHFENLPHYSGSTLSLRFTVDTPKCYARGYQQGNVPNVRSLIASGLQPSSDPITRTNTPAGALANPQETINGAVQVNRVEVQVTYVVAALLQSTNGVVELQL